MDLKRLTFPNAGLTVEEHGSQTLLLTTDKWVISVRSMDSRAANLALNAQRRMVRSRVCREDVLDAGGGLTIYRFLRGAKGTIHAGQADYILAFPNGWAEARAFPRDFNESFDVTPFDRLLSSFRLADQPCKDCEVLPAWQRYQQTRKPGTALGKFALYMEPASICLGNYERAFSDSSRMFTRADFARGGRQVAPDLIEFYAKGDPTAVRVDIWLGNRPAQSGEKEVFAAQLRTESPSATLWSFDEPYQTSIPPGDYRVTVMRINPGKDSSDYLTGGERLSRDDLERYEILLSPQAPR
jgi:hypothetical protein